jgi:hypothetical protein
MFAFSIKRFIINLFVPADVMLFQQEVLHVPTYNVFVFLSFQRPDENLDVSLSVPQYNGHPPPSHLRYHNLNDQVRANSNFIILKQLYSN